MIFLLVITHFLDQLDSDMSILNIKTRSERYNNFYHLEKQQSFIVRKPSEKSPKNHSGKLNTTCLL
jgi:hypothetical protein